MEFIGRRFGHIRVTDVIGRGGMGDVYVGYDEKLDRKVALKVLHADSRLDAESRERLLREARALSKLDHPNICRIYDYIESSDVDILVLEYIDGQTLQDVVMDQSLSRGERLRIAIAVTEVFVAVHRVGIIHRDLKPENVMLTKRGDVKVLDFGLARWLNVITTGKRLRAVSASAPTAPIADDSDNLWFPVDDSSVTALVRQAAAGKHFRHTAVGITMGTPLYMSPEQARGDELTTASDMYALGLLLQFLFTGTDPHPMGLTAREVILRASRGETAEMRGVAGDVAALVSRLQQFAPADRPTAVETVARLKYLADKGRRSARRAAVAAVVLALVFGVWRYTTDLARERTIAETRRAQAEDLINFMVGDLRTKLDAVQRLDILDDVAEKALKYVGSSDPRTASTPELIAQVQALNQLGEVRIGQGNLAGAMVLFRQSLDRATTAVDREPKNDQARFQLALSRFWIANGLRKQDDPARAMEHARLYLALTSDLAARHPSNDKYVLESAYAHSLNGVLLEDLRNLKGAIAEYRITLAIKDAYAASHPGDDVAREDVARTMNKLGVALQKSGELQTARQLFENEVALREPLLRRNPTQMRWKYDLAVSHSFLASVSEDLGETDGWRKHRLADVKLHGELVAYDGANTSWRRNLAIAKARLGWFEGLHGDFAAAQREFREAEGSLVALVASNPKRTSWRGDLGRTQANYARMLLAKGDVAGARRKAEDAIQTSEAKAGNATLGYAHLVRGYVRERENAPAAARESWQTAAELLRPVGSESSDVRELDSWARVLIALDRREEASGVIARLRELGFHNQDFQSLLRSRGY